MVQLEIVHFVVKYDVPCNDWLEIVTPDDKWRVCGAYRSTVKSAAVNITFHSDQDTGHEGVWIRYSGKSADCFLVLGSVSLAVFRTAIALSL